MHTRYTTEIDISTGEIHREVIQRTKPFEVSDEPSSDYEVIANDSWLYDKIVARSFVSAEEADSRALDFALAVSEQLKVIIAKLEGH